jgi:hypothetical protein
MNLVKIPDTNFVRDINSMAIINHNETERNDYNTKVQMMRATKEEINKVKSEINGIKDDMAEIKQLMLKLLDKN